MTFSIDNTKNYYLKTNHYLIKINYPQHLKQFNSPINLYLCNAI